jgi:hypothetical protein
MKYSKLVFGLMFILNIAFAQDTITGKVIATNTQGFTVIGCLIDLSMQDCNYDKSQYVETNPDGSYTLTNLEAGQYLVIAWKDTNGNGQLEDDGSDELAYYTDASGEAVLVSAPATNITLTLSAPANQPTATNPLTTNLPATTNNPLTNTAPTIDLVGSWSNVSTTGVEFYDPSTGSWGDVSGNASEFTLNTDGSCEIYVLLQSSLYSSSAKIFAVTTGTYTFDGAILSITGTTRERAWSQDELSRDETKPFSNTYRIVFTDGNTLILDDDLTLSRRPQ